MKRLTETYNEETNSCQKKETIFFSIPSNIYTARKEDNSNFFCVLKPLENRALKLFSSKNTNKPDKISTFCVYTKDETEIEPFTGFISIEYLKHWLEGSLENKLSNTNMILV